jgi:hypothetical protein
MLVAILAVVASVGIAAWRSTQVEMRYPTQITTVPVAHETTTVANPSLARGQSRVLIPGQDGLLRTFTYFEERWVGGRLLERKQIDPGARPTSRWVTTPTLEVVEIGGAASPVYQLAADNERGLTIGRIGRAATLSFRITGSVTFAGAVTVSGPHGNARYTAYRTPLRPNVYPGAALVRVGRGGWLALAEIGENAGVYTVRGKVGDMVWTVVNDAPRYYADNRGSFTVSIVGAR